MFNVVKGLALLAWITHGTSALPPCTCTRVAKPVCGTDLVSYDNRCMLECAQQSNPGIQLKHNGACTREEIVNSCVCNLIYKPVCGSDGKTYPNECALDCEKKVNPRLHMTSETNCEQPISNGCICTYEYKPVCGTDGRTYPNNCAFNCEKQRDPKSNLQIAHKGMCPEKNKRSAPQCTCTRDMDLVCGTDGNTYNNPCLLHCAAESNRGLKIAHPGSCDNSVKVVDNNNQVKVAEFNPQFNPSCFCTRNLQPVCGSDGNTYNNPCLLNCAAEINRGLRIAHVGSCDNSVKVVDNSNQVHVVDSNPQYNPSCTCTRNLQPVCGTDGKTYNNECLLGCNKVTAPHLEVAHPGTCEQVQIVENSDQVKVATPQISGCGPCTRNLRPVCASDGNTYSNECVMSCSNPTLSIVRPGSCY